MPISPDSRVRFNLSQTEVLLFDPTPAGLAILSQILSGLGARNLHRCQTLGEAKGVVATHQLDLMIIDGVAESGEGYEFVRAMRKSAAEPNRYAPVLITAAHTRASDVTKARDCGGHIMVTKPFAPIVVLERIIWIAREGRAFLQSETYTGPDRRIAKNEPPADHPRRRREDAEPSAVAFGGVQTFDQADPSRPIPAAQSAKAAS